MKRFTLLFIPVLWLLQPASAQLLKEKYQPTRADSVRGTYGPYRSWWDLQHYDLWVEPNVQTQTITGKNKITFKVLTEGQPKLQLDLQKPMRLDSAFFQGKKVQFERYEQAYLLTLNDIPAVGQEGVLDVYFHGEPKVAENPPWDGGLIWTTDDKSNMWISEACQGLGASVWWPCKDHDSDEPDRGVTFSVTVPKGFVDVSNGNLTGRKNVGADKEMFTWNVKSPINSYNVTMNVGKYVKFEDVYEGLNGRLPMQFWFLEQHEATAKKHLLAEAKLMLKTFEYWFGPYPFYEDGYKLIETPFLGMEHQSGIAYGNKFLKGYLGTDLSGSGWGFKWDYILIHESGHEWFGNNITAKDVADMWIHEGFTTYSEVLYVETQYGKNAADLYARGLRRNIQNDRPIIGTYGVSREGSGDMYFKGVQIIHTYRQIVNDDVKFRNMLLEMNKRFWHKTVTTQEVEALMQEYTDTDLHGFFDAYLRGTKIPKLHLEHSEMDSKRLEARFTDVPDNFVMPVNLKINGKPYRVAIGTKPVYVAPTQPNAKNEFVVDGNYYVEF